jgi:hypothetical protein
LPPIFRGRAIAEVTIPVAAVRLLYFGSEFSYRRFIGVSLRITRDLCAGSPRIARAEAGSTGGSTDLLPHFWPHFMHAGSVDARSYEFDFVTTTRWAEGAAVTILERDLFSASALILDRITHEEFGVGKFQADDFIRQRNPLPLFVPGLPQDVRRITAACEAASKAMETIPSTWEELDDRRPIADMDDVCPHFEALHRLADLLDHYGMRVGDPAEDLVIRFAPRSQVVEGTSHKILRKVLPDLRSLLAEFQRAGREVYKGDLLDFVARFSDVTGRLCRVATALDGRDPAPPPMASLCAVGVTPEAGDGSRTNEGEEPIIPAARWTRELTLREAAKLLGIGTRGSEKKAAAILKRRIEAKRIKAIFRNRMSYRFDMNDFSEGVRDKVRPPIE